MARMRRWLAGDDALCLIMALTLGALIFITLMTWR